MQIFGFGLTCEAHVRGVKGEKCACFPDKFIFRQSQNSLITEFAQLGGVVSMVTGATAELRSIGRCEERC